MKSVGLSISDIITAGLNALYGSHFSHFLSDDGIGLSGDYYSIDTNYGLSDADGSDAAKTDGSGDANGTDGTDSVVLTVIWRQVWLGHLELGLN